MRVMLLAATVFHLWIAPLSFLVLPSAASATVYNISWISTNPLFSGKDIPIFTDNLKMNDRIRFSCSSNGTERTAIHRVDERSALDCHLAANFVDSLVGTCTKANDSVIIRLREIPMLPNEMSYKPDQDYFFITTSTGDENGLENGDGGLCRTNNMRLKIRVGSKPTSFHQKTPEITQSINNGPVMMIPVESGQYAVPVVYVPVAQSPKVSDDDKKGPPFPYRLYFANGQFRATNSNLEELGPRAGVGTLSYPFKNLLPISHKDKDVNGESLFDAGDQAKDFGNAANADGFVAPKSLKDDEVDFEIEYVDSASKRLCNGDVSATVMAIVTYISVADSFL